MNVAVITLSDYGARLAQRLVRDFPEWRVYVHESVDPQAEVEHFSRIADLTTELFHQYKALVYIAPCGVVVRALAPHLEHKTTDPAVVVVDAGGRWAISLLSGHEGGANDLAVAVANCLGAEPVISTTTEAVKRLIVGIGCRRGVAAQTIVSAVTATLREANLDLAQVRILASADVKRDEHGLKVAAEELGIPLRFIESAEIRECARSFEASRFVEEQVNVPAVAEPCALLAGRRTRLLAPRRIHNGVTVAVAEESSLSWE